MIQNSQGHFMIQNCSTKEISLIRSQTSIHKVFLRNKVIISVFSRVTFSSIVYILITEMMLKYVQTRSMD